MASKVNIGLRHILVVYPFLFMLAGNAAADLWNRSWRAVVLIVLAAAYLGQAAMIAPHHLSYFNLAAGGSANGHRLLIGSNYDSGQNDHFLRRYIEQRGIAYKVNPDAYQPTTGHILVKANAFYGAYGHGGPAAYAWLKRFQPVNQIAYTWFEYDLPKNAFPPGYRVTDRGPRNAFRPWNQDVEPDRLDAGLDQITLYLRGLRVRYRDVTDPSLHYAFARAFVATADYRSVLDELRLALEQDPDFGAALGLGGELMVRWKVGILRFKGDQYLSGFQSRPVGEPPTAPSLPSVTPLIRLAGISRQMSRLNFSLAQALERQDRHLDAAEHYRAALQLAPHPTQPPPSGGGS
jgi:tetratricopeptide (TPR) repeat protein